MEVEELKQQLESIKTESEIAWRNYQDVERVEKEKMKVIVQPLEDAWHKLHRVQSALETLIAHYELPNQASN